LEGLYPEANQKISLAMMGNKRKTGKYKIGTVHKIKQGHKANKTSFKIGNDHPNYKGGKEDYGTTKNEWDIIKKRILQRDNFICQICQKDLRNNRFNIHHKIPFRRSKDNSDNNLISLCISCHIKEEYKCQKE
jgi:hypothetical protein